MPLRIIESDDPAGLSAARNTGVRAASGAIVAFLDDDAEARPGWLDRLAAAYAPDVIGVGGAIRPAWEGGARPPWLPREFDWVVGCTYLGSPVVRAEVRNMLGANMSFRRAALSAAGPFDTRLGRVGRRPSGAEETELAIRARAAVPGSPILLEPAAIVDHHVPLRRQRPGYFVARCWAEGRSKALLARIHGGGGSLATERAYALRTLPAGVVRGIRDTVRGDAAGLVRSAMIIFGLATTVAGFAAAQVSLALERRGPVRLGVADARPRGAAGE
jgi:hypothetical protein